MTIPVSTVDSVKDYLVTQITAQVNDSTVLVVYDPPGPYQPDDIICIGPDLTVDTQIHAFVGSGGAHWLRESYTLTVIISVYRGADNASVVWKRAKALADAVDTVVRTDPTLGGVAQVAWPSRTQYASDWAENHAGRMTTVTKEISVEAEI